MSFQILEHLKKNLHHHASRMACNSLLYNWSLSGSIPDKLLLSPQEPWGGSAEKGRLLCQSGVFSKNGVQYELYNGHWEPVSMAREGLDYIHSFAWLQDLKACGGDQARQNARAYVKNWIGRYRNWDSYTWQCDLLGQRMAHWISTYEFFGASADEDFQVRFFESLVKQTRHLSRALPGGHSGYPLLLAIKGLIYAGLALEGCEQKIQQGLQLLVKQIDQQILSDGGHISRSPQILMDVIRLLIDIRSALNLAKYPVPEKIQYALDRGVQALRAFRHGDRGFVLFHGTQEGDQDVMKNIFLHSGSRAKTVQSLPHTGFERAAMGRSLLIMDCGAPPSWPHDDHVHAAPLAFEFSYGRERIFTSCGTHPGAKDWREALRGTPAHNTVTLDNRNACEIGADGHIGRKPSTGTMNGSATREDTDYSSLLEACHDGYVPLNGVTHRRRLFLHQNGHDLRGEDTLNCAVGLSKPVPYAVRFHIHPRVLVSLVQNDHEALLRLHSGPGWRFYLTGGTLKLENSIYLGDGNTPRKTKQLVIYGQMNQDTAQIKWALQKED